MSLPSPKTPDKNEKSKKYDRQIRLWGEHGQNMLESATICLVNATALGCEVLKSLVLPGIGGFTIVDGSLVTEDDLGNNFFFDGSFVGKSKALSCMQLLQELNGDVNGDYVDESVDFILKNRPYFFDNFDVVIATNLSENNLLQLADLLWNSDIPFVYCRSLGFFGSIRLQIKEHYVIEEHPDNRPPDLRLEKPFSALKDHLENTKISNKVPWLLVLNKYLQLWRNKMNNLDVPSTFEEKMQLRDMILKDVTDSQDNYSEAMKAVTTAFGNSNVTANVQLILNDDECNNLNKKSKVFWIMVKSLKDFIQSEGQGLLPLAGVLPDMTADTNSYIKLQNIYRQQALVDADIIYRKCQSYLKEFGRPEDMITEREIRVFSREVAGLNLFRGSKISDEYKKNSRVLSIVDDLEDQDSLTELYLALRTYERFLTEVGNIPGECYIENDTSRLKSLASKMLSEWGTHAILSEDMIHEICRYGGVEIHSISAFIGGCAAQEIVKIITKQYKPIDNTFLYNGISSSTAILKL